MLFFSPSVKEFKKEVDFTDLANESLKREIYRAQVIESRNYASSETLEHYNALINNEIASINGSLYG